MKLSYDDLKEAAGQSQEMNEAVEEATGGGEEATSTGPGRVARTAMEEFVEMKKAEKELEQVMAEEKGTSFMDALTEFMADPQAREMLKQLWYGTDGSDSGGGQAQQVPPSMVEAGPGAEASDKVGPESLPEEKPAADGGSPDMEPDVVYGLLIQVLENIAGMKPDMTAEQMLTYGRENEQLIKTEIEQYLEHIEA